MHGDDFFTVSMIIYDSGYAFDIFLKHIKHSFKMYMYFADCLNPSKKI